MRDRRRTWPFVGAGLWTIIALQTLTLAIITDAVAPKLLSLGAVLCAAGALWNERVRDRRVGRDV